MLDNIIAILLFPFIYITQSSSQYYLPTYFGAALTAVLLYVLYHRRAQFRLHKERLGRFLFPQKIYSHPSTRLDLKLVFVSIYYVALQGIALYWLAPKSVDFSHDLIAALLGPGNPGGTPSLAISLLAAFLSFMAVEFGYWYAHYLMHRVRWLWEFHKVHHSAEVLTPLTEWRQHPLELAFVPLLMALANAVVVGPIVWYWGPDVLMLKVGTANVFFMVFWYTILHLRHTHLPFAATGWLGHIIQSPAHHQLHHSTDPRHYDTNLGYCLSVWDWAFGTLCMPVKGQRLAYGLGHKDEELETVTGSLVAPVTRALGLLTRRGRNKNFVAPAE